jgi:hypothetical protein
MNTLYIKTTDKQIRSHIPRNRVLIKEEVISYNGTSSDILYIIESEWDYSLLVEKYSRFGTVLSKLEAYVLGTTLQPNRTIPANDPEPAREYTFDDVIYMDLEDAMDIRCEAVDVKTASLISAGHNYDTYDFSLSLSAQSNLIALRTQYDNGTLTDISPDKALTTIDDEKYMLPCSGIVEFTDNAWNVVNAILDVGRDLKHSIKQLTEIQDIHDFVDPR